MLGLVSPFSNVRTEGWCFWESFSSTLVTICLQWFQVSCFLTKILISDKKEVDEKEPSSLVAIFSSRKGIFSRFLPVLI